MSRLVGPMVGSLAAVSRVGVRLRRRVRRSQEDYLPPLSPSETRQLLDTRARRNLNMSADEFVRRLKAGDLPDTSVVQGLAMLVGEDLSSRAGSR